MPEVPMKYHLTIWTDDGFKRELDVPSPPDFDPPLSGHRSFVHITDSDGVQWFFNRNHVLGGTIKQIE